MRVHLEVDTVRGTTRLLGWFCQKCKAFNGAEKEVLEACRVCETKRHGPLGTLERRRLVGLMKAYDRYMIDKRDIPMGFIGRLIARSNLRISHHD